MDDSFCPVIQVIEEAYEIPQLGRTRRIAALLPCDYHETDTHYPVLYLHDGQNLFNKDAPYGNWALDKSLEAMAGEGFRDLIIIAIDHGDEERVMEYSPYYNSRFGEGKGHLYLEFLMDRLKPYVDRTFRVLPGRENTGIGGSSMGGLISLYAGISYPDVFGKLMIFSPSLWINPMVFEDAFRFAPESPTDLYVYAGGQESNNHLHNVNRLMKALRDGSPAPDRLRLELSINPEGRHSEEFWGNEFPRAAKWLFFNQTFPSMHTEDQTSVEEAENGQAPYDIIIPFFKGDVREETVRHLSGVRHIPEFEGNFKEVEVIYHPIEERKVYLLGLGEEKTIARASEAFRSLAFHHHKKWHAQVSVVLDHLPAEVAYHASLGTTLATYRAGMFKTDQGEKPVFMNGAFRLDLRHPGAPLEEWEEAGRITASTQMNLMRLVDSPGNKKRPEDLARYAAQSAHTYGYKAEILHRDQLIEEGLHALLAVGQGSHNPPVLIKLEYKPDHLDSSRPKLGLVGKGITFDTGGLSIKASANMHYMKSDMGGAAAVIGAVELAARLKLDIHVVGIVPSAENSVDAEAVKPGDVIDSYSGKTIEVIDTDAEGRLILADGLAYITRNYNPEIVIDLATLTGSIVRTLGYAAGGLFTQNDHLAGDLEQVGEDVHERLWRLPLWDDYKGDLHSDVADVRNFSGKPIHGAISAAKFLEFFIPDHPNWAHMDIAGVAFGDSEYTKMKSATGYGIRLLTAFMKKLT